MHLTKEQEKLLSQYKVKCKLFEEIHRDERELNKEFFYFRKILSVAKWYNQYLK